MCKKMLQKLVWKKVVHKMWEKGQVTWKDHKISVRDVWMGSQDPLAIKSGKGSKKRTRRASSNPSVVKEEQAKCEVDAK